MEFALVGYCVGIAGCHVIFLNENFLMKVWTEERTGVLINDSM